MGAEQAIFVRRDNRVTMELDGNTITDVSVEDHRKLVERAAAVLGLALCPAGQHNRIAEDAIYWLETPAEFDITDGVAICSLQSGRARFQFRSRVATAQQGANSWACAFASNLGRQLASVIPFPKGKAGH